MKGPLAIARARYWVPILGILILLGVGVVFRGPSPPHPVPRQAVYVWQRVWTPPVETAVEQSAASVDVFMVLAGEFEAADGKIKPLAVAPGWKTWAEAKKPVWAVLRAHQLPGIADVGLRKGLADTVAMLARDAMDSGRTAGVNMRGVQLDYDCPTAGLGDYAGFLGELRSTLADTTLSITALPDWLSAPAFPEVLRGLDHFVLQVHSLEKPARADASVTLCDPVLARRWIRAAGKLGTPFYVALPTYGYHLFFNPRGDFVALSAEAGPKNLSAGSMRELQADPLAMAALVREVGPELPSNAVGWTWFRLPVEGDTLNWTWPVLRGVMAGQAPRSALKAEMRTPSEGLYELWLRNAGDYCPVNPVQLTLRWKGAAPGAYDAIGGFHVREGGENGVMVLEGMAPKPGEEIMVAWFRVVKPGFEVVKVDVAP